MIIAEAKSIYPVEINIHRKNYSVLLKYETKPNQKGGDKNEHHSQTNKVTCNTLLNKSKD